MPRYSERATSSPAASQAAADSTSGGSSSASAVVQALRLTLLPQQGRSFSLPRLNVEGGKRWKQNASGHLAAHAPCAECPLFWKESPRSGRSDLPACRILPYAARWAVGAAVRSIFFLRTATLCGGCVGSQVPARVLLQLFPSTFGRGRERDRLCRGSRVRRRACSGSGGRRAASRDRIFSGPGCSWR